MSDDLQQAVDELALRLGRSVLLEDHLQRVIAYSEQTEPMDDVRRDSILRRHTTPEVRRWSRTAGVFDSAGPLRVPAAPGLRFGCSTSTIRGRRWKRSDPRGRRVGHRSI